MKKIFKIIVIFAIIISFFRFDVVYALEENEISAGGTALSDFPSPYIPLGNLIYPNGNEDIYENNDNNDSAIRLNPEDYNNLDLYRTKVQGTLDYDFEIVDYDYYCFTILTESYITILTESSNSGLYDIALLTKTYEEAENNNLYSDLSQIDYLDARDYCKIYKTVLNPGVYYIVSIGKQQETNLVVSYELNLYVEKVNTCDTFQVEAMKAKKGLKNAIIGFVLIFILLIGLQIGLEVFTDWWRNYAY